MRFKNLLLIIPAATVPAFAALAQSDYFHHTLDSVVFVTKVNSSGLSGKADQLNMNIGLLSSLPRVLGSSDPLRLVQYLPGVQTNAEYDNGIRIQGCDNVHNYIGLDGIPVYGSSHLLGLFSIFNNGHFKTVGFEPQAMIPNRLGGEVNMRPSTDLHPGVEGGFETGLISTQGSISFPLGEKCEVGIALRQSYINLLYGNFLVIDGSPLNYTFTDANLSFLWRISPEDKIWTEGYYGRDGMNYRYSPITFDLSAGWGNLLGGLNWEHIWTRDVSMTHKIFATQYNVGMNFEQDVLLASVPSSLSTFGYSGCLTSDGWKAGVDLQYHKAKPQSPTSDWITAENKNEIQEALESSLWISKSWSFDSGFEIDALAKLPIYLSPESELFCNFAPSLKFSYDFNRYGKLSVRCGSGMQFLFQTGVSNTGMPTEFYFLSGKHCGPQQSIGLDIDHDVQLFQGALSLSATLYYKHLINQVEYYGSLLDLVVKQYDLDNCLIIGSGDNYGLAFMARKNSGMFTGWLSYSLGRSLRHFDSSVLCGTYPSSHERIHQLNAVGNCKLGRWELGGTFVLSSGTPFTAPKSYYLYEEQIISELGEFNGARMPAYIRLDLSVNWYIHKGPGMQNGLNLSVYNVLCRENSMTCRMNIYNGEYGYGSICLPMLFMPSISYFHRF